MLAAALSFAAPASAEETVTVPAFNAVQLSGGGSITVRPGGRQRVTIITGSSKFTPIRVEGDGRLRIQGCSYPCPPGYRLKIVIESPRVPDLAVNGGGDIVAATGFALQPKLSTAVRRRHDGRAPGRGYQRVGRSYGRRRHQGAAALRSDCRGPRWRRHPLFRQSASHISCIRWRLRAPPALG